MTKPIYFPHTYMSPAVAAAIRSAFTAVAGYQPVAARLSPDMRELAESGFLEIVSLAPEDEEPLHRVLQEFERWGRLQQGGAGLLSVFLSNRPGSDPLTVDGTAARIASEIRRQPGSGAPPPEPEPLLRSAAFLQLAHEADQQSCEVSAALQRCERVQAELFDALAGEDARPHLESVALPGGLRAAERDSLLGQRVRAWARLFLHRPYPGPVFVSASAEVVGLLAEKFPSLRRIHRSALEQTTCAGAVSEPSAARDFLARLERVASRPLPDAGASDEGDDAPSVYAVPDVSPLRLFAILAESGEAPEAAAAATAWRNTVFVELSRRTPQSPHKI